MITETIYDLDLELKNEWESLNQDEQRVLMSYMAKINRNQKVSIDFFNRVNEILDKHDITVACVPKV